MTKTQDFYGAAKAAPLQNSAPQSFFRSLLRRALMQNDLSESFWMLYYRESKESSN